LSKNIQTIPQINSRQATSLPLDDRIKLLKTQEFDDELIDSVKEELDRLLKADQSQMLTMDTKKQLFLALRNLFNRKTFFEKVEDCLDQNWGGRLRAASLTKRVLRDYQKYIPQFGAPVYRLYEQLIKEVDAYCMGLMGLFKPDHLLDDIEKYVHDAKEFKNHLPDRLLKPEIPVESIQRCDKHLKRINELVEQLTADYV
jgi:hypothetical protein